MKITPINFHPSDISEEIQSLKLGRACGFDGIPNERLWHLPRKPLVHLTHLFNHCLCLGHFLAPWKEAKIIILLKPGKDPKFPPNLHLLSLLSTKGNLSKKLISRTIQKHNEARSQSGFQADHSTTLQC
jgi:hypothetical protein